MICSLCHKPLDLETAKADEHGKAVHDECYALNLKKTASGVDRASGRVSDFRDGAQNLYGREDHTVRNVVSFAARLGLGVGAAMLFAPAKRKASPGL